MTNLKNVFFGTAVATIMSVGAAAADTVLTLNNWLPPSHPYFADLIAPLAEDIKTVTEGRVTVNVLPAPLGPPPATFDLVKNGVVDIGFTVQGYNPGRFKTASLAELPFLGDDAVVTSVAFQRVHDALLAGAGEYDGVKVMAVHTHGPGQLFSTSDIAKADDISGQKIRVGSVVAHDLTSLLGAVPVEGPSSKSYELLSQKVADGILFPWESVNFFRLNDLVSNAFVAEGGLYNTAFVIAMNEGKWNSIPEADRALIEPLLGEALAARAGAMWNDADAKGRAVLEENLAVYTATGTEVDGLTEQFKSIVDANIALVSETGVDGQAAYDMLLSEIEKLSAE